MSMMWSIPVSSPSGDRAPSSSLWWATGWIRPVPAPVSARAAVAAGCRPRGRVRTWLLLLWWSFWLRRGLSRALARHSALSGRPPG